MSKLSIVLGAALLFVVAGAATGHIPAVLTGVLIAIFGGVSCMKRVRRSNSAGPIS